MNQLTGLLLMIILVKSNGQSIEKLLPASTSVVEENINKNDDKNGIEYLIDDTDDSMTIIYSKVPMNNLVKTCFQSIPLKYRERCLSSSFERYAGSVYVQKSRCCTKWQQMTCLEKYTYNNIYCNFHQQSAIKRYFDQIRSRSADGSPECPDYRPIEEERSLWSSSLGRRAKCSEEVEHELLHILQRRYIEQQKEKNNRKDHQQTGHDNFESFDDFDQWTK